MSYTKSYTAWQDFPNVSTPATAAKLQNMDDGIYNAVQSVSAISATISAVSAQAYGSVQKSVGSASGDILYFSGPSTPTRLAIGSSGQVLGVSAGLPKYITNTAVATLSSSSKALSADVAMATAATFYDGPSLSLAAGTWLLTTTITLTRSGGGTKFVAKVWDGTTVQASTEGTISAANDVLSLHLACTVVLGSTTTMKVSATATNNSATIKAATPDSSAGNNASTLYAVQIA